jgi:hypothetical protein
VYLKVRDHPEDLGVSRRIIPKLDLKKWNGVALAGFIHFRVGKSGGLLWKKE